MGSTAAFEEPTLSKVHRAQEDEEDDEVGDLERKRSSFHREERTVSADSSTITITTSGSSSSSSSSDSTESFCTDERNAKELGVDQINAAEAEILKAPEMPEQVKDREFHGEHNDEKGDNVYFDEGQGLESNGTAGAEPDALESHTLPDTGNGSTAKDKEQSLEIEEIGLSDSPEDPKAVHQLDAGLIEVEEYTEVDYYGVEKVLENQETHDLYCPNCNSCITKRVVLKRRKRKIRHVLEDAKRERLDVPVGQSTDGSSPGDGAQAIDRDPEVTGPENEGPFLLRCLSCFSIFFPTGKLFPSVKADTEIETPLLPQQTATEKPSWFVSIFGPKKKETAIEGGATASDSQVNPRGNLDSSPETTTGPAAEDPSTGQVAGGPTTLIPDGAANSGSQVNPPPSDKNGTPDANDPSKTEVPVQHVDTTLAQDDKPVDTESQVHSRNSAVSEVETTRDGLGFLASLADKDSSLSNGNKQPDKVSLSPIQPVYNVEAVGKVTVGPNEVKTDPLPAEPKDSSTPKLDPALVKGTGGGKLEIFSDPGYVETNPPANAFGNLPTDSLLADRNEIEAGFTPLVAVVEGRKVEILKSIVYGGLIESITSLGVISSAAGSGASTLNILVLGLANLIGGLILIVHKIQELREEDPRRTVTDGNQISEQEEDRYKRLLGRRENFKIHATVAILSFIFVGLIPPVVYGFSFRKSDNRDYKAVSVLAASLVCIILLAIANAHVKRPRGSYLKSVLYYTTVAVSASGISYFVGHIVSQLLEKYGWSEDGSDNQAKLMLPLLGRKAGFEYSSY